MTPRLHMFFVNANPCVCCLNPYFVGWQVYSPTYVGYNTYLFVWLRPYFFFFTVQAQFFRFLNLLELFVQPLHVVLKMIFVVGDTPWFMLPLTHPLQMPERDQSSAWGPVESFGGRTGRRRFSPSVEATKNGAWSGIVKNGGFKLITLW